RTLVDEARGRDVVRVQAGDEFAHLALGTRIVIDPSGRHADEGDGHFALRLRGHGALRRRRFGCVIATERSEALRAREDTQERDEYEQEAGACRCTTRRVAVRLQESLNT